MNRKIEDLEARAAQILKSVKVTKRDGEILALVYYNIGAPLLDRIRRLEDLARASAMNQHAASPKPCLIKRGAK